jgi:hypothetical protein
MEIALEVMNKPVNRRKITRFHPQGSGLLIRQSI